MLELVYKSNGREVKNIINILDKNKIFSIEPYSRIISIEDNMIKVINFRRTYYGFISTNTNYYIIESVENIEKLLHIFCFLNNPVEISEIHDDEIIVRDSRTIDPDTYKVEGIKNNKLVIRREPEFDIRLISFIIKKRDDFWFVDRYKIEGEEFICQTLR